MSDERPTLSIEELARTADVPVRTVRYYVAEGLVPGPGTRGKGAAYSAEHLTRLLLIRRLAERHIPLAEIRRLVERLSPDEAHELLREEEHHQSALPPETGATSPKAYISGLLDRARAARIADSGEPFRAAPRSPYSVQQTPPPAPSPPQPPSSSQPSEPGATGVWERWELAPGLELHVQTPLDERRRRLVERIAQVARDELSRDSS